MRALFAGSRGRWVAAVLKEAKRLLTHGGWVQGNEARDRAGNLNWWPLASDAVAWSLEGAIIRAANDIATLRNMQASARDKLESLAALACELELSPRYMRRHPLAEFNDDPETTWGDVLAVLERAIVRAELEGANNE